MLIGAIGDDFTGSGDLANMIAKTGMETRLYAGALPDRAGGEAAAVVALKTRTLPVAEAVAQSLDAMRWLRGQGAERILFKYCSTFDSTPRAISARWPRPWPMSWAQIRCCSCPAFPTPGARSIRAICS